MCGFFRGGGLCNVKFHLTQVLFCISLVFGLKYVFCVCVNQETIIESENEALEFMGRVDEGVEEFFTKRVLPTDAL